MSKSPHDPNTKPSRLNRRRNRNWKNRGLIEIGLTDCTQAAILYLSISRSTGIGTPISNGAKTPIQGVFYCLKKIVTPLVRAFVMVARSGQPQGWPAPLPGSSNPLRVAAQSFKPLRGGLILQAME
jgi:hypothetical protein